jgi:hypothetical protein
VIFLLIFNDLIINALIINDQLGHFSLADVKIGLALQYLAHLHTILLLVALSAGRPDRWTTGSVEQAELDAYRVGDLSHNAAKGVHFADQVPFSDATHGGVTGHLGDQIGVQGKQRGLETHAGRRHGGFTAGMTGSDHDYIELFTELRHKRLALDILQVFVCATRREKACPAAGPFRPRTNQNLFRLRHGAAGFGRGLERGSEGAGSFPHRGLFLFTDVFACI